jgi:hypothetical protein
MHITQKPLNCKVSQEKMLIIRAFLECVAASKIILQRERSELRWLEHIF